MVELAATLFVILVLANFIGFTLHTVGWIPIAIVLGAIAFLICLMLFPDYTMTVGAGILAVTGWAYYTQNRPSFPPPGWDAVNKAREEWERERRLGKRIV